MTDRAEIERLLNKTGRTLEGLPTQEEYCNLKDYGDRCEELDRALSEGGFESTYPCMFHQSDVIELLVGALRDALDKPMQKPMQKPLTLKEVNKYDEPVWIEFKVFSSANGWREGIFDVLYWVQKVYKGMSNPEMGVVYRLWRCKPTDEEMEAAPWQS